VNHNCLDYNIIKRNIRGRVATLNPFSNPEGGPSLCLRFLQTQGGDFDHSFNPWFSLTTSSWFRQLTLWPILLPCSVLPQRGCWRCYFSNNNRTGKWRENPLMHGPEPCDLGTSDQNAAESRGREGSESRQLWAPFSIGWSRRTGSPLPCGRDSASSAWGFGSRKSRANRRG